MNQGIYPLAATMINQLNRVDVLSNNLANSNTNGYKQEHLSEGSFNNYLRKAMKESKPITKINVITNTIPKIDNKFTDDMLGSITPTQNRLDFAMKSKNIFFKVQNPKTKEILLTKDGQFDILNNKLVTKDGYLVLDNTNNPINTNDDNFEVQISATKSSYLNLEKQGYNNYRIISNNDIENIPNTQDHIVQGALEKSNVNSVLAMVGLIDSHRRFEQAQKAMTGIDEINQELINKIGNNR